MAGSRRLFIEIEIVKNSLTVIQLFPLLIKPQFEWFLYGGVLSPSEAICDRLAPAGLGGKVETYFLHINISKISRNDN